jgi:hypothetical protein
MTIATGAVSSVAGLLRLLERIGDIQIVSRCHRRGGHGRGARQRRWRPGFQRGDRIADVRRLRRGAVAPPSAARCVG